MLCILGVIVLILRRLPEAQNLSKPREEKNSLANKLEEKGIQAEKFNRLLAKLKFWLHKIWSLALEAKDLKPAPGAYNLKKLFQTKTKNQAAKTPEPVFSPAEQNQEPEEVLLERIKQDPKNRKHYDDLGKLYLAKQLYTDAKDIYLYLVGHEVSNSTYHARLAQAAFLLKDFPLAENHFSKSLALDKMHPNRYYNLGLSQECQEKWKDAAGSFYRALEMEPQNEKYKLGFDRAKTMAQQ
ncbi:MAG: hypothetical protein JNN11_04200 [Candidatus Doudnabacteria bacterium]|nr:hypothetical protein [Candidatus Doudnabacteria bacterium]